MMIFLVLIVNFIFMMVNISNVANLVSGFDALDETG